MADNVEQIARYLEDRDRALENYLDKLAGEAISITTITEELAVFPPSLHADTHAAGGTDELTPADIGAATPADVAAGDAATAAAAAAATLAVEGLGWMQAWDRNEAARLPVAVAGGSGADEALVWMDASDKNEGLRLPLAGAGGTPYDEGVLWMQGQTDQDARQRGDAANAAAAAALAAAIAAAQLGTDAQGLSYMESWDKNAGLTYPVATPAVAAGLDEALHWMEPGDNDPRAEQTRVKADDLETLAWMLVNP